MVVATWPNTGVQVHNFGFGDHTDENLSPGNPPLIPMTPVFPPGLKLS